MGDVVPEPYRLYRLSPTNRRRRNNVKTRANPVAFRCMDNRLLLLVTTGLVQFRDDEHGWRLGLHLRGSAFTGYGNRTMVGGFDTKLVEVKMRGGTDTQARRYRRRWARAIILSTAFGTPIA